MLDTVSLESLITSIKSEHPVLGEPVVRNGGLSWRLPTGWVFLAREEASGLVIAVSKGDRPSAWIPTTETEAVGSLRWFLRRKD